jgi:DNA polymerase-3 subunit gamma/tau
MQPASYRVLARKYRPSTFSDLIGQDVLVRTLSNAINSGRIAHAFLLTGIRGVGKTTTARIIARALNCIGTNEKGGPTPEPCGVCSNCKMIGEDRHPDVIEMDAASHTGVNDIREIIDSVHYAASSARFKIHIIDEVHMLSSNAFNALLKTLEEPPPHVKFIFATTELRKIPITILSRCQRFDLRRVDIETLSKHLQQVASNENIVVDPEAVKLIATAAEGSVRDSLSLLDQAIAHSISPDTACHVKSDTVRVMLGMADKTKLFELLEHLFLADVAACIGQFNDMMVAGADPIIVLQDVLELTHFITRLKLAPEDETSMLTYSESERNLAKKLSDKLPMMALSRAWQMLLKGVGEARFAPNPLSAAEMILIRTAYASNLPTPSESIAQLKSGNMGIAGQQPLAGSIQKITSASNSPLAQRSSGLSDTTQMTSHALQMQVTTAPQTTMSLDSYLDVVSIFEQKRELILYTYLKQDVRLVSFAEGRIEMQVAEHVPADMPQKISKLLSQWTGNRWVVMVSQEQGQPSIKEQEDKRFGEQKQQALEHPLIKDVMGAFPGAEIIDFKPA